LLRPGRVIRDSYVSDPKPLAGRNGGARGVRWRCRIVLVEGCLVMVRTLRWRCDEKLDASRPPVSRFACSPVPDPGQITVAWGRRDEWTGGSPEPLRATRGNCGERRICAVAHGEAGGGDGSCEGKAKRGRNEVRCCPEWMKWKKVGCRCGRCPDANDPHPSQSASPRPVPSRRTI
jgi:hypothetical protein